MKEERTRVSDLHMLYRDANGKLPQKVVLHVCTSQTECSRPEDGIDADRA